jgi:hypothetical protein
VIILAELVYLKTCTFSVKGFDSIGIPITDLLVEQFAFRLPLSHQKNDEFKSKICFFRVLLFIDFFYEMKMVFFCLFGINRYRDIISGFELNEKIIFQENLKVSWKSSDDVIKGQ